MKRHFRIAPGGILVPAFQEDAEWAAKKGRGTLIEVDAKEPRNWKLLAKWWSLCAFIAEHNSAFPNKDKVNDWMLIQLGFCTEVRTRRGVERIADSIAFSNMTESTFQEVYGKACDLLCEIIPHVTDQNVAQVLAEYAGVGAMMGAER